MKLKKLILPFALSLAAVGLVSCGANKNTTTGGNTGGNTSGEAGGTTGGSTGGSTGGNTGGEAGGNSGSESKDPVNETFTVNFNTTGGTDVASQTVNSGAYLSNIATPQRDGFLFSGWYEDASLTTVFDTTTKIEKGYTLYAKWREISPFDIVSSVAGYTEGMYILFEESTPASSAISVEYKKAGSALYTKVDNELIREESTGIARVDILGLEAGLYEVRVVNSESKGQILENVQVTKEDRSGYAHFVYENDSTNWDKIGVGAYKNDGTLKDNAIVVYVTDATKNTVSLTVGGKTYTGLSEIVQNSEKIRKPLAIRFLDTVKAATWNHLSVSAYGEANSETVKGANGKYLACQTYTEEQIIDDGAGGSYNTLNTDVATKLNGLTNKVKWDASKKEFDSYYNMLDVTGAKNITVEGVGNDAGLFQWGFTWKASTSVEVKNLTFEDYTEDACSAEGWEEATTMCEFKSGHIWIHNNTFLKGVNYWDVCSEQDKHDGDGSTDFKRNIFITVSYNHYIDNHKTGLVGGSDTQKTSSITFHHNWYDHCQSRLPFARQANMHMYNNFYDHSSGTNMQLYAGAYAFIENCYFKQANKPMEVKASDGKIAAAKLYNNIFESCPGTNGGTTVSSRAESVVNGNLYGQTFDIDPSIFYYDLSKSKSNVDLMLAASDVEAYVGLYAGAGANNCKSKDYSKDINEDNGETIIPEEVDAIKTDGIPTSAGFYCKNASSVLAETSEDLTSTNKASMSNGTIKIIDTSADTTTFVYYMFEDSDIYNSGVVTYSFSMALNSVGSKWSMAHFLGADGSDLAIRALGNEGTYKSTKYIGYSLDNAINMDEVENLISATAFGASTYDVELTINYSTNTATLKVGSNSVTINNYSASIKGLMFQTANTAADRSFRVSDISVSKK